MSRNEKFAIMGLVFGYMLLRLGIIRTFIVFFLAYIFVKYQDNIDSFIERYYR